MSLKWNQKIPHKVAGETQTITDYHAQYLEGMRRNSLETKVAPPISQVSQLAETEDYTDSMRTNDKVMTNV